MSSIFGSRRQPSHQSNGRVNGKHHELPYHQPEVPEVPNNVSTFKPNGLGGPRSNNNEVNEDSSGKASPSSYKPKLAFHCQQAQGSPTGIISGFTNVKELYQKIAECYDMEANEILFCTLNTHKVDMKRLLGGQIGLEDFIFAHRKGRPKEVEVTKTDDALGLTITDNGAGYAFIKRIRENSVISKLECIQVGDHIERIDQVSVVGSRHFEVAKMLKVIPKGHSFVLRVVEPLKAGFSHIGPRNSGGTGGKKGYGTGRQTLRFKSDGQAKIEDVDEARTAAEDMINQLLENFLGINDEDLASQIWELSKEQTNTMDFAMAIDDSDLESFGFTDEFIFELWGAVTDAKAGRLPQQIKASPFSQEEF